MKCPKCGYVSHDYLNACRKCSVDLMGFKAQMQLHAVQVGNIDLRIALGGVQPSPIASGEFELGEALFDSPMLGDSQAEDGFDISLDDDFSFTPSGMSLESLDGFELSNVESVEARNPEPQSSAVPDGPGKDSSDTGYATVMMDISGLDDEVPPHEPGGDLLAGDLIDAPIEFAGPDSDAPIESAEAVIELPDLPVDDAIVEPELTSAELRSSVGRTSDLDITSMELKRTTRDIEMFNQLQNEALSGDTILPQIDEPAVNEEAARSGSGVSGSGIDGPNAAGTDDLAVADIHQEATLPDDAASPFAPDLPEAFPEETEDAEGLNKDSGELVLPSFDTRVIAIDDPASGSSGSAADDPEASFTMPDLPDIVEEDKPVNPFTEEISIEIDPEAPPAPLPTDFPSLQTSVIPVPLPEAAPPVDEASTPDPAPPAMDNDATGSPDTKFMTMELELDDPASSQPNEAPINATPQETTHPDEPSPPSPVEPSAGSSSDTGYATIEIDIGDAQPPVTPDEAPDLPKLPEPTDAMFTPSPNEATIVDEPSPFASTDRTPTGPPGASANTGYATIELDVSDIHSPGEPAFPELPEPTDAALTPSPDEATIVDEPSPFASTGHTPVDFTIAPPNADFATIELDIGGSQPTAPPDDAPVLPDLPQPTDALMTPSPDEATIVDEPSPFLPGGRLPDDLSVAPPEAVRAEDDPDADEIDNNLDLELLFPDEQPPKKRD